MKTNAFDCVEMKRQGQRRLRALLKDMTVEQEIEWWRKRNEEFMRKQEPFLAQRPARAGIAHAPIGWR